MIPHIETPHLVMRPYRRTDVETLHRLWLIADAHLRLKEAVVSRAWVEAEVERNAACFERHGFGQWAVCRKTDDALVGFCGFRFFDEPAECQLLYSFGRAFWQEPLVMEAARAMIAYGFEIHGFDEITACADPPNHASIWVLERVQMKYAGRVIVNGFDAIYYTLPRTEWHEDHVPYRLRAA